MLLQQRVIRNAGYGGRWYVPSDCKGRYQTHNVKIIMMSSTICVVMRRGVVSFTGWQRWGFRNLACCEDRYGDKGRSSSDSKRNFVMTIYSSLEEMNHCIDRSNEIVQADTHERRHNECHSCSAHNITDVPQRSKRKN